MFLDLIDNCKEVDNREVVISSIATKEALSICEIKPFIKQMCNINLMALT